MGTSSETESDIEGRQIPRISKIKSVIVILKEFFSMSKQKQKNLKFF